MACFYLRRYNCTHSRAYIFFQPNDIFSVFSSGPHWIKDLMLASAVICVCISTFLRRSEQIVIVSCEKGSLCSSVVGMLSFQCFVTLWFTSSFTVAQQNQHLHTHSRVWVMNYCCCEAATSNPLVWCALPVLGSCGGRTMLSCNFTPILQHDIVFLPINTFKCSTLD